MINLDLAYPEDGYAMQLRQEDYEEALLYEGRGAPGGHRLALSIQASHEAMKAVDEDGNILAIGGIQHFPGRVCPWVVCSPLIHKHRRFAVGFSQRWIANFCNQLPPGTLVCNYIGKTSRSNRRFVEMLGFTIVPAPSGPFDFFYLQVPHV